MNETRMRDTLRVRGDVFKSFESAREEERKIKYINTTQREGDSMIEAPLKLSLCLQCKPPKHNSSPKTKLKEIATSAFRKPSLAFKGRFTLLITDNGHKFHVLFRKLASPANLGNY
uniref:Uncharacterized protein n=1 Tax=Glossina austeni TaxID=7395 RepID=A0A1A9UF74_GLOAU